MKVRFLSGRSSSQTGEAVGACVRESTPKVEKIEWWGVVPIPENWGPKVSESREKILMAGEAARIAGENPNRG